MLTIEHLDVHYGDLQVLWDISLEVHTGEIVAMVGSNGAGKSTLIRTIAGLHRPTRGLIGLEGLPMQGLTPHRIVDLGVSMVPEGRRLFPKMTVLQNLEIGAFLPRARKEKDATLESVYEIFPILKARSRQAAGLLSGGEQQMLAIGRALMAKSKLLLLDEMSLGLSPIVVQQMFDVVLHVNKEGIAIFMVEQNVPMTLKVAHRAYVMESGRIVIQGNAHELLESPHVKAAYLGIT